MSSPQKIGGFTTDLGNTKIVPIEKEGIEIDLDGDGQLDYVKLLQHEEDRFEIVAEMGNGCNLKLHELVQPRLMPFFNGLLYQYRLINNLRAEDVDGDGDSDIVFDQYSITYGIKPLEEPNYKACRIMVEAGDEKVAVPCNAKVVDWGIKNIYFVENMNE